MLGQYNNLRVVFGEGHEADAVLVGVVHSAVHYRDAYQVAATKFTAGLLEESIGERNQFYVPTATKYDFTVQTVLIKRPVKEELDLIKSDLGVYLKNHPKIIFNESLALSKTYSHIVADNAGQNPDRGGVVNATKNNAIFERSLNEAAVEFSETFKEVIINAF